MVLFILSSTLGLNAQDIMTFARVFTGLDRQLPRANFEEVPSTNGAFLGNTKQYKTGITPQKIRARDPKQCVRSRGVAAESLEI